MVGLLFAFMPVLSHPPGQDVDPSQLLRLLIKCALCPKSYAKPPKACVPCP